MVVVCVIDAEGFTLSGCGVAASLSHEAAPDLFQVAPVELV